MGEGGGGGGSEATAPCSPSRPGQPGAERCGAAAETPAEGVGTESSRAPVPSLRPLRLFLALFTGLSLSGFRLSLSIPFPVSLLHPPPRLFIYFFPLLLCSSLSPGKAKLRVET